MARAVARTKQEQSRVRVRLACSEKRNFEDAAGRRRGLGWLVLPAQWRDRIHRRPCHWPRRRGIAGCNSDYSADRVSYDSDQANASFVTIYKKDAETSEEDFALGYRTRRTPAEVRVFSESKTPGSTRFARLTWG